MVRIDNHNVVPQSICMDHTACECDRLSIEEDMGASREQRLTVVFPRPLHIREPWPDSGNIKSISEDWKRLGTRGVSEVAPILMTFLEYYE